MLTASAMKSLQGQYYGAALHAFVKGLSQSESLILQILRAHGLERIEPDQWYDLNTARSIYYMVGRQVGERSLHAVGLQMINSARFPPEIRDVRGVLLSLDHAYHMNVRGPEIGSIAVEFAGDDTALVTFDRTPFPCALRRGVTVGAARKFMSHALLEHGPDGCIDRGGSSCTFHVTW
jgi:hypothetical protein